MTLSPGTTDVKEMPCDGLSVDINVENMLRNTHSLDASMEDVVYERD